jgi:SAM-dependent methyltransferase
LGEGWGSLGRRVEPYQFLAAVYDGGWSDYSEYVFALIEELERESKRTFHTICDAACGTGILLSELASDGIDRRLFGYDRSPEMVRLARIRVPSATIEEGDLTDPPAILRDGPDRGDQAPGGGHTPDGGSAPGGGQAPGGGHTPGGSAPGGGQAAGGAHLPRRSAPRRFDLITCVYDSLNYLTTPDELTAFFRATREMIAPDGVLLVDLNARALYADRDGTSHPRLIDGIPVRETLEYTDGPPPNATTTFTFDEGVEVHHQRPWEPDEVEAILDETGWRQLDTLDVMDADEDVASGKIVYLAVPGTDEL